MTRPERRASKFTVQLESGWSHTTWRGVFYRNCSPTPVMEKAMFINVIRAGGILDAMQ